MSIYWEEGGSFPFLILLKAFRYARKKLSDGGGERIRLTTIVFYFWTTSTGVFLFSLYLYWREEVTWFLLEIESAIWVGKGGCCCRLFVQTVGKWRAPAILALFSSCVCLSVSLSPLFSIQVARRPNFIYYYSVRSIDGTAADVYTDGRRTYTQKVPPPPPAPPCYWIKNTRKCGLVCLIRNFPRPLAVLFEADLISWETG